MATNKIAIRQDTAANWTSENPTLDDGELGHESDTCRTKIGDGSTAWNSLNYIDTLPAERDIWLLTSPYTSVGSGTVNLTANLARSTIGGFSVVGSGMSESSGVFTFPSTGRWQVRWVVSWSPPSSPMNYVGARIAFNGVSAYIASGYSNQPSTSSYATTEAFVELDVTNVSQTVLLAVETPGSGAVAFGTSTSMRTYATFEKVRE